MKYFYHGSKIGGIKELKACSKLHNKDMQVVYLTDNIPYSLFYIWDEKHNGLHEKYVTGGIREGMAFYEEQFPEQLKTFYQGVSGYLYAIDNASDIYRVENREGLFYTQESAAVAKEEYIADVYEELLKQEAMGKLRLLRYNEQSKQRQSELVDMIATAIARADFYQNDEEQQKFMKKHFSKAWERAGKFTE